MKTTGNRWTNYMLGGAADRLRTAIVRHAQRNGMKFKKRAYTAEWISSGLRKSDVEYAK